jgi:hypothetical protein
MRIITSLLITLLLAVCLCGPAAGEGVRADQYPDYTDLADADQMLFWRTAATDLGNISGFNFKVWLKSMLGYDADGDGYVNAAEGLNDGLGNISPASAVRSHLDDATKHRLINDAGIAVTDLWSASKIAGELAGKEPADATILKSGTVNLVGVVLQAFIVKGGIVNFRSDSAVCDDAHPNHATELAAVAAWGLGTTNIKCDSFPPLDPSSPTITIAGVSGTGAVGTLTVSGTANVTAALTGVSGTGAVGTLGVSASAGGDAVAGLTGVSGTGGVGTLGITIQQDGTVTLSGVQGTGAVGTLTVTAAGTAPDHTTTWESGLDGWTENPGPDTPSDWGRTTLWSPYAGAYHFRLSGTDDGADGYTSGFISQTFANVTTGNITIYAKQVGPGAHVKVHRNGVQIGDITPTASYAQYSVPVTGGTNITIEIESNFADADGSDIDNIVIPGGG